MPATPLNSPGPCIANLCAQARIQKAHLLSPVEEALPRGLGFEFLRKPLSNLLNLGQLAQVVYPGVFAPVHRANLDPHGS